jgi:hypothetical protein
MAIQVKVTPVKGKSYTMTVDSSAEISKLSKGVLKGHKLRIMKRKGEPKWTGRQANYLNIIDMRGHGREADL